MNAQPGDAFRQLTEGVSQLTDLYRVYKVTRDLLEVRTMSRATRVADKLRTVKNMVNQSADDLEKRADALLTRGASLKDRADKAFKPHHAEFDELEKGIGEFETALDEFTGDNTKNPT